MKYSTVLFLVTLLSPMGSRVLSWAIPAPNDNLNIYSLPVGQGDSTVIQCPKQYGNEISIIDAGTIKSTGFTKKDYIDFIQGQNVSNVILSHPDEDHVSFVDAIYESLEANGLLPYPPLYHSCSMLKYKWFIRNTNAQAKQRRIMKCCGKGDCNRIIPMCNGAVSIRIIASEFNNCGCHGTNGDSIVSLLEYGGKTNYLLVTGDFEGNEQFINSFLACAGDDISAVVYRLAHHGSYGHGANSFPLLDAISAEYVFSSSGVKLNFKHPRCEIYDYYRDPCHEATTATKHLYQCYDSNNLLSTVTTDKAIYTTTLFKYPNVFKNTILNFFIGCDHSRLINHSGFTMKCINVTQAQCIVPPPDPPIAPLPPQLIALPPPLVPPPASCAQSIDPRDIRDLKAFIPVH